MNRRIKVLYNGTLGLMKYIVCMKSATDIPTNFKDWSVCLFKTKALNNPTYVKIVFWTITNKYRILYLSFSRADAQHLEYNQNCATVVKLTWLKISYVKALWVSEIIYTLIKYIHVCIKGLSGRFCRTVVSNLPTNSQKTLLSHPSLFHQTSGFYLSTVRLH